MQSKSLWGRLRDFDHTDAATVLRVTHQNLEPPVNLKELSEVLEIALYIDEGLQPEVLGYVKTRYNKPPDIYLGDLCTRQYRRVGLATLIGHALMLPSGKPYWAVKDLPLTGFAQELLMPRWMVSIVWREQGMTLAKMADIFDVPESLMASRLKSIKGT